MLEVKHPYDVVMCEATVMRWSRGRLILYVPKKIQEKLAEHDVKKVKLVIYVEKKCKKNQVQV